MAKTIKELAEEQFPYIKGLEETNVIMDKNRDVFYLGANAVINEVEMLLNSQKFVDSSSQELLNLSKQLKGK